MPQSNFAFLSTVAPSIARLGAQAEAYAKRDPHTSLFKLRLLGEHLAQACATSVGLRLEEIDGQHDLINALRRSKAVSPAEAQLLHTVRQQGNKAAHELRDDHASAEQCLRYAHSLCASIGGRVWAGVNAEAFAPLSASTGLDETENAVRVLTSELSEITQSRSSQGSRREDDAANLTRELVALKRELQAREEELRNARDAAARDQALSTRLAALETLLASSRRALDSTVHAAASSASHKPVQDAERAPVPVYLAPPCPNCGEEMIKRVARKGPNPGQEFWGCPAFPGCRGTLKLEQGILQDADPDAAAEPTSPPFQWIEAEWRHDAERSGWTTEYLDLGGRLRALDPIGRLAPEFQSSASHISLHKNLRRLGASDDDNHPGIWLGAIARRLALRGSRPPVDPRVEHVILEKVGLKDSLERALHPGDLAKTIAPGSPTPSPESLARCLLRRSPFQLDERIRLFDGNSLLHTTYERPFFEGLTDGSLGDAIGHWITPQASLDSLVSSDVEWHARRVDFLAWHPDMERPLVVEIDGAQHESAQSVDRGRDNELTDRGLEVLRFVGTPGMAEAIEDVALLLPESHSARSRADELSAELLAWAPAIANRTLLCFAEAILDGLLSPSTRAIALRESSGLGYVMVQSALELLDALAGVYATEAVPSTVDLVIGRQVLRLQRTSRGHFSISRTSKDWQHTKADFAVTIEVDKGPLHQLVASFEGTPEYVVRSAFLPVRPRSVPFTPNSFERVAAPDVPEAAALQRLLEGLFAKAAFQPEGPEPRAQEVAIRRLLAGKDTVALLPTGAGKSLIYQMAGLLQPGVTVIIDPLVSLIDDQIEGLRSHGIDRAIGITGADTRGGTAESKLQTLRSGGALFIFVAPERLQSAKFREAVRELSTGVPVSCAVVDEAHCVSEWGHDFRTSYLDLGKVLRDVCQNAFGIAPPILALTGTASRSVLKDMLIELGIDRSEPDMLLAPDTFDRPELSFQVIYAAPDELSDRLLGVLASLPRLFRARGMPSSTSAIIQPRGAHSVCGIVFCRTVGDARTGPKGVTTVARTLRNRLGVPVLTYSGKLTDAEKRRNARAFKDNEATILVATKSFGMGIDKPNIRYVVHMGIPGSIESYYQEAGRAGRSRQDSHCIILSSDEDLDLIDFFHERTYRGADTDLQEIRSVLDEIGDVPQRGRRDIAMGGAEKRVDRERAIHRLKLLGLVTDYTVDFGGKRFSCKVQPVTAQSLDDALLRFVRRSQPARAVAFQRDLVADVTGDWRERLERHAKRMLDFIYETIAASRYQAAREMSLLASQSRDGAEIRDRILRYLSLSELADTLEVMVDAPTFSFDDWIGHFDAIEAGDDARDWRGATARLLGSSPDHPGLLVGRGLAEAVVLRGDRAVFRSNLFEGLKSASEKYGVDRDSLARAVAHLLAWTRMRVPHWTTDLYDASDMLFPDSVPDAVEAQERFVLEPRTVASGAETSIVLDRRTRRSRQVIIETARWLTGRPE